MARWLYASAALAATTASKSYSSGAAIQLHQPRSLSTSAASPVGIAALNFYTESAAAWGVPASMSKTGYLNISAPTALLFSESATAWNTPINMQTEYSALVAQASQSYAKMSALGIHYAAPKYLENAIPQLGTDYYTIRPSEYDLRQSELLTGVSNVFNLTVPNHIPSPIFNIASYRLTDLPAYPIYAGGMFSVHQPADKAAIANAPWGVGESLYAQPDLPYTVQPPLIPGYGYIPNPNAREVHITMNVVNVVALPNNEPLAVADIKIDLDLESYSWKLSCDVLNAASIALLKPDAGGNKELAVEINGHRWVFFVASWSQGKTVTDSALNRRFSISGYSRTQYLGLPYAPRRTRSISTTTAVQAVNDELFGTGFTTSWNVTDLPDWTMPNASFSYQELTALQVIKRLATAAGAVVQPAMDTDALTVRPRYLPAPWELATAEMDRTIHESQILSEGGQLETNDLINAVFVTGESEGVALTVTRAGTAGDIAGQDVVDAWLTAIEANTSRGKQEIAASGDRIISTLELAIPESTAQPGLLLPGHAVAVIYNDSALSYRAYVTAVAISVPGRGLAKVRQTVTLERPIGWEV